MTRLQHYRQYAKNPTLESFKLLVTTKEELQKALREEVAAIRKEMREERDEEKKEEKNSFSAMDKLIKDIKINIKVDKWDAPVKFEDYLTPEDIKDIVAHIESRIRIPKDGISIKGIKGTDGVDGHTPKKNVDYFDGKDGEDAPKPNYELLVERVYKELTEGKRKLSIKHLNDWQDPAVVLERFIARGSLRGGGDTVAAGSGISILNANGVKTISSLGSGSSLTSETPTGTIDDVGVTFTVLNTPVFISVNGALYVSGTGIFTSYAAGTITLSSPVGVGGFIRSFYAA